MERFTNLQDAHKAAQRLATLIDCEVAVMPSGSSSYYLLRESAHDADMWTHICEAYAIRVASPVFLD